MVQSDNPTHFPRRRKMKVKLTNKEIINLFNAISGLSISGTPKFTYTLSRNRGVLEKIVEALREADKSYAENNTRVAEYTAAGEKLIVKYSTDKNGRINTRPTGQPGQVQRVVPIEKMSDYMQERMLLDGEFKDMLVGLDAHQRAIESLMHEEVETDLR